jgi:hypothetical protein
MIVSILNPDEVNHKQLSCVEEIDIFFLRLTSKETPVYENKILSSVNTYFEKGHFIAYNNAFTRFVKNIKSLSEPEMHKFIIRYTISSIIKRNWDNFSSDVFYLKNHYTQYDMNIYL